MKEENRKILLDVTKSTVSAAVSGGRFDLPRVDEGELTEKCGCFVTLKNAGRLRGCIGMFVSDKPLIETVSEMAVAATKDSRFFNDPVTADELSQLDIEISVLSPLKKTDDPLSLRLGVDGIYIKKGYASGCFLPQVVTETGWTKEQFLSQCCLHKANLPSDAWADADTDVYLFSAEIIE